MTDYFAGIRASRDAPKPAAKTASGYRKTRQGGHGVSPAIDEVVRYVQTYSTREGAPPTIEQVRIHMGWKRPESVRDALKRCGARLSETVLNQMMPRRRSRGVE